MKIEKMREDMNASDDPVFVQALVKRKPFDDKKRKENSVIAVVTFIGMLNPVCQ